MGKIETLYRRYSNDLKIEFEVTAIKTRRTLLASASYDGDELAHRFFDCSFHDIQNEDEAHDKAIAWCMGAKEFYDALCNSETIDVEKLIEQAEYYKER